MERRGERKKTDLVAHPHNCRSFEGPVAIGDLVFPPHGPHNRHQERGWVVASPAAVAGRVRRHRVSRLRLQELPIRRSETHQVRVSCISHDLQSLPWAGAQCRRRHLAAGVCSDELVEEDP